MNPGAISFTNLYKGRASKGSVGLFPGSIKAPTYAYGIESLPFGGSGKA